MRMLVSRRIPSRITAALRRRARGNALLELALVLPLLCLLLLGVFDLGRMYSEQVTVVAAAREGARAAMYIDDDAEVRAIVVTNIDGFVEVDPATDIQITRDLVGTQTVSIGVTYPHTLLFGLLGSVPNGGRLTLHARATMPVGQVFGGTPGPVNTPPPTGTPAPTETPTNTPTAPPTAPPTETPLPTPTVFGTATPTPAATETPIPTVVATQPPTNTPEASATPTETPAPTGTATATATPCPLTVAVVYAQQRSSQRRVYVRVYVTDACTGAPVVGATVFASPQGQPLSFVPWTQNGYYEVCGESLTDWITSITVTALKGGQSGTGSGAVTPNNQASCPPTP
jgi:hypothetical protein